jgi:hypothetical protein
MLAAPIKRLSFLIVGVLLLAVAWFILDPPSSIRAVYPSPSGDYRLVIHSNYRLFAMPGDASGAPGYVDLIDRSGRKLATVRIPLVLDVSSPEDIHWYAHSVSVPGVFDLPVPGP